MKTQKQIDNAYTRASKLAHEAVQASQRELFAATQEQMSSERGNAANAAGFAAQALAKLENGDYASFLSCLRLAGQFAEKATSAAYAREVA